ncbi:MAG: DUF6580 family putative transport protein [archaeon]
MQKTILRQKKKQKDRITAKEKVAVHALQKQIQVLNLKQYLLLIGFASAAALLRVPMQAIPSAEPLTFFAILAGWLFGARKGAMVGAGSLYISNFLVFGGQGPWTLPQAIAFGAAGFFGGMLRKKAKFLEIVMVTLVATLVFEIIMNISWSLTIGGNIFLSFITGLPFFFMHVFSNCSFSVIMPFIRKQIDRIGGFDEQKLCREMIERIKAKTTRTRHLSLR